MTSVNFEVIKIEKAMKHGCMVAEFISMQTIR